MDRRIAFLFDMDGVIVDSNPAHKISLKQFCQRYGKDLDEEQLKQKIYGRTNKDWIPALFGPLSKEEISRYGDEKEALFRELYASTIKPLDGLVEFLERVANAGIERAIATSAPRANVDFTLERTGTGRFFETILDESFVERGKPDPEIYLKAAAALGFKPSDCLVFEDSLSGVRSGLAAGCRVVAVTTTHSVSELSDAHYVINDFRKLDPVELIRSIF